MQCRPYLKRIKFMGSQYTSTFLAEMHTANSSRLGHLFSTSSIILWFSVPNLVSLLSDIDLIIKWQIRAQTEACWNIYCQLHVSSMSWPCCFNISMFCYIFFCFLHNASIECTKNNVHIFFSKVVISSLFHSLLFSLLTKIVVKEHVIYVNYWFSQD